MEKGFKVQIFPNAEQQKLMFKSFGCARFAYNWALAKQKSSDKFIKDEVLRKEFTQFKKQEDFKWLYDTNNNVTKQAIKDCCKAFKNFFEGRAKYPKFKSKRKSKFSHYNDTAKISFNENQVKLESIGFVGLAECNRIPTDCKYLNPRVSFDGIKFWISITCVLASETNKSPKTEPIGIDLGIKTLMVCSNGMKFKKVNTQKETKKLKRLQKQASRLYEKMKKEKMEKKENIEKEPKEKLSKSKNLLKLEQKILKQHQRITNIRKNNIHQSTSALIKLNPSHIIIEDLNVIGMMKNKHLSEKLADCSFYEIERQLTYKSDRNNTKIIIADRWYPSSKTCSSCGYKKPKLSLSERNFTCECCGNIIDRDFNASLNLRNLAYN